MLKKIGLSIVVVGIISGLLFSFTWFEITMASENADREDIGTVDVIIVLGAGVWPMGPSPALQARVYRAVELYEEGIAPRIIFTGGLGEYPPTEAEAGAEAAIGLGLPQDAVVLEKESKNTYENLANVQRIMADQGWNTGVVVTDTFHIRRALLVGNHLGLDLSAKPAVQSVLNRQRNLRLRYTFREVFGLWSYRLQLLFGRLG